MIPEDIMKVTYAGLEAFLQKLLTPHDFQLYLDYKHRHFPTWNHMWRVCEPWLREHNFHNMPNTIQSLAQVIPNSNTFYNQLSNSIHLHEDFWNKVYSNLLVAKSRFTTC